MKITSLIQRISSIAIFTLFIVSCDEGNTTTETNNRDIGIISAISRDQEFCLIVDKYREQYNSIQSKKNYLDKETDIKSTLMDHRKSIVEFLGNGDVKAWKVKISYLSSTMDGSGALVQFDLPCKAELHSSADRLIIKRDSELYGSLRAFAEGDEALIYGEFEKADGSSESMQLGKYPFDRFAPFGEVSFTESGSIENPEFTFILRKIVKLS